MPVRGEEADRYDALRGVRDGVCGAFRDGRFQGFQSGCWIPPALRSGASDAGAGEEWEGCEV